MHTSRKALGGFLAGLLIIVAVVAATGSQKAVGSGVKNTGGDVVLADASVAKPRPIGSETVTGEDGVRGLVRPTPMRRGGRRGWDPRQMRMQITGAFQMNLQVEQDKWTEVEPLLWSLIENRLDDWRLVMPFRPLREAEMSPAMKALFEALDAGDVTPENLEALMNDCREEHKTAKAEREQAMARLRELLTAEQQAWLIVRRILEPAE